MVTNYALKKYLEGLRIDDHKELMIVKLTCLNIKIIVKKFVLKDLE